MTPRLVLLALVLIACAATPCDLNDKDAIADYIHQVRKQAIFDKIVHELRRKPADRALLIDNVRTSNEDDKLYAKDAVKLANDMGFKAELSSNGEDGFHFWVFGLTQDVSRPVVRDTCS